MHTKEYGNHIFGCECCPVTFESRTGDFQEAVDNLKGEGWMIKRGEVDWEHYCEDCSKAQ